MTPLVIVPNALMDAINAAIDRELAGRPCDDETREYLYSELLNYFHEHGQIPDFQLRDKERP